MGCAFNLGFPAVVVRAVDCFVRQVMHLDYARVQACKVQNHDPKVDARYRLDYFAATIFLLLYDGCSRRGTLCLQLTPAWYQFVALTVFVIKDAPDPLIDPK